MKRTGNELKAESMSEHVRNWLVRTIVLLSVILAVLPAGIAGFAAERDAASAAGNLGVMTYNLRFASTNPPNAWPQRRPVMRELIQKLSPDIIGTQEGLLGQLRDLAQDLPEYTWTGIGRDDGREKGEFMAVFYRTNRLQPLSTNHYWLSDTPEVAGSTTWGNSNRRMVTYLKFEDRRTRQQFYFLDTHFDHQVQPAREKSAQLVRERVKALNTDLPLLLVGDFNAAAGKNKAYSMLVEDGFFSDAWSLAATRAGDQFGTFNGFKGLNENGPRIDWILARGKVSVQRIEIVTYSRDGQFPSDHCPVIASLRLGE
jgi:endonuclease/exonuclease/phosphatase family metal-dependent hydrolase